MRKPIAQHDCLGFDNIFLLLNSSRCNLATIHINLCSEYRQWFGGKILRCINFFSGHHSGF